ncbi:MAG: RNA polymerase-binding protein RbpA [Actinomycetaceae bacterium]|nr:RNA polymerase-binding protein RbpA [Actinomycetaceae bacterium]
MAERALRGTSIGAKSLESEEGVVFAERMQATYECKKGHSFHVAFAIEAFPPDEWECMCGEPALLRGRNEPEPDKPVKPVRTHWDMLIERRSIEELDELLEEQLKVLRSGRLREGAHYQM